MPIFNYQIAPVSRSGAAATADLLEVETCFALDRMESGRIVLQVPGGISQGPNKSVQCTRTAGTRTFAGIVHYNPGKPSEEYLPEYDEGEAVPVIRKGRVWVYCENWGTLDPMLADLALFFVRNADGVDPLKAGNLRYGDNDTATCTAMLGKILRVHDARILAGSAALIHVECAF